MASMVTRSGGRRNVPLSAAGPPAATGGVSQPRPARLHVVIRPANGAAAFSDGDLAGLLAQLRDCGTVVDGAGGARYVRRLRTVDLDALRDAWPASASISHATINHARPGSLKDFASQLHDHLARDLAQPLAPPGGSGAVAGGRQAASEGDAGGSGRGGVSAAAVTPDSAVFSQSGSAATRLAALRAEVDNVPNLPADLLRALLTCARVHPPPAADAGAAEMRYSWLQVILQRNRELLALAAPPPLTGGAAGGVAAAVAPAAEPDAPPPPPSAGGAAGGGVDMYDLTFGMGRDAPFERAPDPALRPARRQLLLARVMAAQASRLGAQLGAGDAAAAAATQVQIMALAGDEQRRARAVALLGAGVVAEVEEELMVEAFTRSGDSASMATLRKSLLGRRLRRRRKKARRAATQPRPAGGAAPQGKRRRRGKGRQRVCYRCGERGHIRPDCPQNSGSSGSSSEDSA